MILLLALLACSEELDWASANVDVAGKHMVTGGFSRNDIPEADLLRWTDGSVLDFRPALAADAGRASGMNVVALRLSDGLLLALEPPSYKLNALCRREAANEAEYFVRVAGEEAMDEPRLDCAEKCWGGAGCSDFSAKPCETKPSSPHYVTKNPQPDLVHHPSSCAEIIERNSSAESGVYWLRLPSEPAYDCAEGNVHCEFTAACDMDTDGGGWTILQRQEAADQDFNRSMHHYELGFGPKDGDHWLGLWKLQALTAYRPTDLLVIARYEGEACAHWALYRNFRLLNYDGYAFTYDSFEPTSTLPDALAPLKDGARFGVFEDEDRRTAACEGLAASRALVREANTTSRDACVAWVHPEPLPTAADAAAACRSAEPLLRLSRLDMGEAETVVHHHGHISGSTWSVDPVVANASPLPEGVEVAEEGHPPEFAWQEKDTSGQCLLFNPHRRKLYRNCQPAAVLCTFPFHRAGTGG